MTLTQITQVMRGVNELRLDQQPNLDTAIASGLLASLAKYDKTLALRLKFLPELEALKSKYPLDTEDRRKLIWSWKKDKCRQFMDEFKNSDPAHMNPNTLAISKYYKATWEKDHTFVGHRVCSDPTLSVFANMMLTIRAASDKLLKVCLTSSPKKMR